MLTYSRVDLDDADLYSKHSTDSETSYIQEELKRLWLQWAADRIHVRFTNWYEENPLD